VWAWGSFDFANTGMNTLVWLVRTIVCRISMSHHTNNKSWDWKK
jgi:hypothetical protein